MGVIIRADAGHIVPVGYFERACKVNSSFWGLAFPAEGKLMYEIADEKPSSAILAENQRAFQENTVLFHLGNAPDGFPPEIQQPFVLLTLPDNEHEPILVALLDGDFKSFEDKKEKPGWTGEALCVEKYLKPKLQKLFRLCDNDLSKVIAEMQEADFETDMDRCYGIYGSITFLAATGECFEFVKNDDAKEYPWGFVSNSYGWLDEDVAAKAAAAQTTNKSKLIKAVQDKKATVQPPGPKDNVVTLPVVAAPGPNEPPAGRDGTTCVLMRCPKNMTKRKVKKHWFKTFAGYLPNDWETNPQVWVLKTDAVKAGSGRLDPIKSFQGLPGSTATDAPPFEPDTSDDDDDEGTDQTAATLIATAGKKVVDGNNASPPPPVDPATVPLHEKLPVIDPQELVKFKGWFKSTAYDDLIKLHKNQVGNPTQFAALESKIPSFVEALGMAGLEETIPWTPAMEYYIACNFPSIARTYANAWKKLAIERGERIDQLEKALHPTDSVAPAIPPIAPAIKTPAPPVNGSGTKRLIKRASIPG
jgi:hypothetical protein